MLFKMEKLRVLIVLLGTMLMQNGQLDGARLWYIHRE